jgi:hypothetical protein
MLSGLYGLLNARMHEAHRFRWDAQRWAEYAKGSIVLQETSGCSPRFLYMSVNYVGHIMFETFCAVTESLVIRVKDLEGDVIPRPPI